jgi:hypothetical protein
MRTKLILRLEDLSVDSFDTAVAQKEKGTVFGEQCTCPGAATCDASCDGSCDTCYESCSFSCDWTCEGDTCGYTCDFAYCYLSKRNTNCINICY